MDRPGIGMPSGYVSPMHFLLRARRSRRLFKNMIAVARMHRNVAVAMKNNSRDSRPVLKIIGPGRSDQTTLPHGDKRRGKVTGGATGEARMHADCRVEILVGCAHDSSRGRSSRQPAYVDALWIDRIVAHDLAGDTRDQRRVTLAPLPGGVAEPVPAFRLVCLT